MPFALFLLTVLLLQTVFPRAAEKPESSWPVKLNSAVVIIPVEAHPFNDTTGLSNGVQQCGGTGQVVEWRIGDCDPKDPGPCAVKGDRYDHPELTFIASRDSDRLDFQSAVVVVGELDESFLLRVKSVNLGRVIKGKRYAVTAGVAHSSLSEGGR